MGEALFYSSVVCLPSLEQVRKLQVLCSGVARELMKEDEGVYGDGGDYGAGDDYASAAEFYLLYRSCLQSFTISLQLAHVQAVKLLAIHPREESLENILELIPSEYRHEMLETRARPLRGETGCSCSPLCTLAHREAWKTALTTTDTMCLDTDAPPASAVPRTVRV